MVGECSGKSFLLASNIQERYGGNDIINAGDRFLVYGWCLLIWSLKNAAG